MGLAVLDPHRLFVGVKVRLALGGAEPMVRVAIRAVVNPAASPPPACGIRGMQACVACAPVIAMTALVALDLFLVALLAGV